MHQQDEAKIFREFNEVLIAESKVEEAQAKGVLDQVSAKVSPEVFADIESCIAESGMVHDLKLTDRPIGQEQDDGYVFGPHFVNQTCNGGYSGDDYEGTVSVPLNASEWLQFSYSM